MEEKVVTLKSTRPRKFFRQYIELLQPMLKLRQREADVFAELLYHNYLKRDIKDTADRFKLVFDISTREKMQDYLKISNSVIQQALGGLRKKGVIKGITLRESFIIVPQDGVFSLTFKFVVEEDESIG